jgi:hypothetical protein
VCLHGKKTGPWSGACARASRCVVKSFTKTLKGTSKN